MTLAKLKACDVGDYHVSCNASTIANDLNDGIIHAFVNNDVVITDAPEHGLRWCDMEITYNAVSLWVIDDDVKFFKRELNNVLL